MRQDTYLKVADAKRKRIVELATVHKLDTQTIMLRLGVGKQVVYRALHPEQAEHKRDKQKLYQRRRAAKIKQQANNGTGNETNSSEAGKFDAAPQVHISLPWYRRWLCKFREYFAVHDGLRPRRLFRSWLSSFYQRR